MVPSGKSYEEESKKHGFSRGMEAGIYKQEMRGKSDENI